MVTWESGCRRKQNKSETLVPYVSTATARKGKRIWRLKGKARRWLHEYQCFGCEKKLFFCITMNLELYWKKDIETKPFYNSNPNTKNVRKENKYDTIQK